MVDGKPVVYKGWSTFAINGTLLFLQSCAQEELVGVYSAEEKMQIRVSLTG
jgi:hypothetical protein